MYRAQKRYMALTGGTPIETNEEGQQNDVLAFASNKGNTIVVKLKDAQNYCIYGFNPKSSHKTAENSYIQSSDGSTCAPLTTSNVIDQSSTLSTVAIIGQRLEAFYTAKGAYLRVSELIDIGLIIKPNAANVNQKQLYCRNNTKAIYLQKDKDNNIIYAYDTATKTILEPTNLLKLSLNDVCPEFAISSSLPGYESTGVKSPAI